MKRAVTAKRLHGGPHSRAGWGVLPALVLTIAVTALLPARAQAPVPEPGWFIDAADRDEKTAEAALERIAASWDDRYASLMVDLVQVVQKRDDGYYLLRRLTRFLENQTGQKFGTDLREWRRWLVSLPYEPHPQYVQFKSFVYQAVDPLMQEFFPPGVKSRIRLDEIDWGGVRVNGIPPLDLPPNIPAAEANFLKDSHVVMGVFLNGEARAYPKRILAWHEMARDRLGRVELTFVYCSLCGSGIPYRSEVNGAVYKFGTSGFLYRSNKLMFDHQTKSLWSSLAGTPVLGPLADSGLQLESVPVVTTTWKEWKESHPETTVLSLDTGHQRDYSEGAAYRDYFATHELMFAVPELDERLQNKEEVLALVVPSGEGDRREAVAISTAFLKKNPVIHLTAAGRDLVVLTTNKGASRVYDSGPVRFTRFRQNRARDSEGRQWRISEEALVLDQDVSRRLVRVPASQAFWFGWFARFPETRLVASQADLH